MRFGADSWRSGLGRNETGSKSSGSKMARVPDDVLELSFCAFVLAANEIAIIRNKNYTMRGAERCIGALKQRPHSQSAL